MKDFIKSLFSDFNGNVSTRRVLVLTPLMTVFILTCIVNLFYGKILSSVLQEQLFYLIIYTVASVFGEPLANAIKPKTTSLGSSEKGGDRPNVPPPNP